MPGYVNLFDSLYHDSVVIEVEEQTNDLLGGRLIALDPKPVQQQTNGSDCGVFCSCHWGQMKRHWVELFSYL